MPNPAALGVALSCLTGHQLVPEFREELWGSKVLGFGFVVPGS